MALLDENIVESTQTIASLPPRDRGVTSLIAAIIAESTQRWGGHLGRMSQMWRDAERAAGTDRESLRAVHSSGARYDEEVLKPSPKPPHKKDASCARTPQFSPSSCPEHKASPPPSPTIAYPTSTRPNSRNSPPPHSPARSHSSNPLPEPQDLVAPSDPVSSSTFTTSRPRRPAESSGTGPSARAGGRSPPRDRRSHYGRAVQWTRDAPHRQGARSSGEGESRYLRAMT